MILVDLRDELGRPPIESTVVVLRRLGVLTASLKEGTKQVQSMVDAGHRYRNFEREICAGICLTLGKTLREY